MLLRKICCSRYREIFNINFCFLDRIHKQFHLSKIECPQQWNSFSTLLQPKSQRKNIWDREFQKHRPNLLCCTVPIRGKSESKSNKNDEEKEIMVKGDKVLKLKLKTTRLDGVLKEGLQISKNKIEKAFYEDRVRINGERPRKKSQLMNEGDEIDLVRGRNELNPEFLDISRVEIIKIGSDVSEDDGGEESDPEDYRIPAVLKRYKALTVQNYSQPFKGVVDE